MSLEIIYDRHTFDFQRKIRLDPMVTVTKNNGSIQFNQSAMLRFNLDQYDYFVFGKVLQSDMHLCIQPTQDPNNGFKATRYKTEMCYYRKLCSKHIVGVMMDLYGIPTNYEKFQFILEKDGLSECGMPIFAMHFKGRKL